MKIEKYSNPSIKQLITLKKALKDAKNWDDTWTVRVPEGYEGLETKTKGFLQYTSVGEYTFIVVE